MIRSAYLAPDNSFTLSDNNLVNQWRQDGGKLWLDFNGKSHETIREQLSLLNCDERAVEDCLRKRHPPKVEAYDKHLFILYRGIAEQLDDISFEHLQVGIFIFKNLLITVHAQPSLAVNNLWQAQSAHYFQKTMLQLGLRIFYQSMGGYLNSLFKFEQKIETIEAKFQHQGNDDMMRELMQYQANLLRIKRIFNYHINIGEQLESLIDDDDIALVAVEDNYMIKELNERLNRLLGLTQMYYDICSDLISGYLSITSHQLNNTMRILTVITTIFVPLTFLAGIYGMNFENMPELKWHYGYVGLLGIMALVAISLVIVFRKKRWF